MRPNFFLRFTMLLSMAIVMLPLHVQAKGSSKLAALEEGLNSIGKDASVGRQRLGVLRAIRDAEKAIQEVGDKPERWALLEFLFGARQRLVSMDNEKENRDALLAVGAELLKAPKEFAAQRLAADLLLSQVEQAKLGGNRAARSEALKQFAKRYEGTDVVAEALRTVCVMALEYGDKRLIDELREMIAVNCAGDPETIVFQRDRFGGFAFGAPFIATLKRSDGKIAHFPMDGLGRVVIIFFWSKEGEGMDFIRGMAEAAKLVRDDPNPRQQIVSMNLDDLPDAGESIIRGLGVDWPCFYLPGGREHTIYKTYGRRDPLRLRLSPTGQAAFVNHDLYRAQLKEDGSPDYERILAMNKQRQWSFDSYRAQLCSIGAGDFLIFDPQGFESALPPELEASPGAQAMVRGDKHVPEDVLHSIQACFVAPKAYYQVSNVEMRTHYRKAVELCRKAMEDHPDAPDLWMVRNRLIVALMGLWKTDLKLTHLEEAFVEAKAAMEAGYPTGADLVARFCLARQAFRAEGANPSAILDAFIADAAGVGSSGAPGPALAVASLLAMDVADRYRFEQYKDAIYQQHTEAPVMWLYTAALLDRHHDYWRFHVPFFIGHSHQRSEKLAKNRGEAEPTQRMLKGELVDADGKVFRIPEDLTQDYTAIFFSRPEPWGTKENKSLPPSPMRMVSGFASDMEKRPERKVQTILAMLDDEPYRKELKDHRGREVKRNFSLMALPGGLENPLVHRLGMLFDKGGINSVLVDKEGRILTAISGIGRQSNISAYALSKLITGQDIERVDAMLEKGDLEAAKEYILRFAPESTGRKVIQVCDDHLRARARVYRALGELDKALRDIKVLIKGQQMASQVTSERTDQLVSDEAFRDSVRDELEKK